MSGLPVYTNARFTPFNRVQNARHINDVRNNITDVGDRLGRLRVDGVCKASGLGYTLENVEELRKLCQTGVELQGRCKQVEDFLGSLLQGKRDVDALDNVAATAGSQQNEHEALAVMQRESELLLRQMEDGSQSSAAGALAEVTSHLPPVFARLLSKVWPRAAPEGASQPVPARVPSLTDASTVGERRNSEHSGDNLRAQLRKRQAEVGEGKAREKEGQERERVLQERVEDLIQRLDSSEKAAVDVGEQLNVERSENGRLESQLAEARERITALEEVADARRDKNAVDAFMLGELQRLQQKLAQFDDVIRTNEKLQASLEIAEDKARGLGDELSQHRKDLRREQDRRQKAEQAHEVTRAENRHTANKLAQEERVRASVQTELTQLIQLNAENTVKANEAERSRQRVEDDLHDREIDLHNANRKLRVSEQEHEGNKATAMQLVGKYDLQIPTADRNKVKACLNMLARKHDKVASELDDAVGDRDGIKASRDDLEGKYRQLKSGFKLVTKERDDLSKRLEDLGDVHNQALCDLDEARSGQESTRTGLSAKVREAKLALQTAQEGHESHLRLERREHDLAMEAVGKGHELAMDAVRKEHASAMQTAQKEHESLLRLMRKEHASAMEGVRQSHTLSMQAARNDHESALQDARQGHKSDMKATRKDYKLALKEAREEHESALQSVHQGYETALQSTHQDHESAMEAAREDHESALQSAQQGYESALQSARQNHESAMDAARQSHESALRAARDQCASATARGNRLTIQYNDLVRARNELAERLNSVNARCRDASQGLAQAKGTSNSLSVQVDGLTAELGVCKDKLARVDNFGAQLVDQPPSAELSKVAAAASQWNGGELAFVAGDHRPWALGGARSVALYPAAVKLYVLAEQGGPADAVFESICDLQNALVRHGSQSLASWIFDLVAGPLANLLWRSAALTFLGRIAAYQLLHHLSVRWGHDRSATVLVTMDIGMPHVGVLSSLCVAQDLDGLSKVASCLRLNDTYVLLQPADDAPGVIIIDASEHCMQWLAPEMASRDEHVLELQTRGSPLLLHLDPRQILWFLKRGF